MIKKSLEENREYILGELPGKFHDDFKAEVENAPESLEIPKEDELERIKTELRYHPNANADVVGEIDSDAHKPLPPLSEAEQKSAMEEELKRTKEEISKAAVE